MKCPTCGDEFERISRHWGGGCPYPSLSASQESVLVGLLLSGATVDHGGAAYNRLTVGTTNQELADKTASALEWLCTGVVTDEQEHDSHNDVYRVSTWSHPAIDEYESWEKLPTNQGRAPPQSFELSPPAARWWYAFAGGMQFSRATEGLEITFSAKGTNRAAWVWRVLQRAGFDATIVGKRVQLSTEPANGWLEWIGEPVAGVEYKWATDRVVYEALKTNPETEQEFVTALFKDALRFTGLSVEEPAALLTLEAYIDIHEAKSLSGWSNDGDWQRAISAAKIARNDEDIRSDLFKHTGEVERTRSYNYTLFEIVEAIQAAAKSEGEPLLMDEYQDWSSNRVAPSSTTIIKRFPRGNWREACAIAGVGCGSKGPNEWDR